MKSKQKLIITLLLIIISVITLSSCKKEYTVEEIQEKMEEALYEKYGEEFVVDRIGIRTFHNDRFYQARIYPKSIIGTEKEGDSYYHATASINIYDNGTLGGVGDSYPLVKLKLDIEDYLKPRAEELFGERIKFNIEAHYKRREPGNITFWGYKVNGLEEARKEIAEDPENRMIELQLFIYIFDRIEDEEEKEERRQQIFDFVQYLKEEDLFRYLEMGVIFIDERVLAPSYHKYMFRLHYGEKVVEEIEGEKVKLPPMELREEMSEVLQEEIDKMSEEELLESMRKIRKSDLSYKGINKDNAQASFYLYSSKLLNMKYKTALEKGILVEKDYTNLGDIEIEYEFEYIYMK